MGESHLLNKEAKLPKRALWRALLVLLRILIRSHLTNASAE